MNDIIRQTLLESLAVQKAFFETHADRIESCARVLASVFHSGGKLLLFGNGGSAADCQHIAAEFVNRFQMERRPLPAIALTTDTSVITSIGNDYAFEDIFLKQVQALGRPGDAALAISTSGNSPNVIKAAAAARNAGMTVIGFSGKAGRLKELSDPAFCVDSDTTARIQETHILLAHILCDLTERMVFND